MRKMNISWEVVYSFTDFTVIPLSKTPQNIFNLIIKNPEANSHLILYDELFKMLCETQYSANTVNIVIDADKLNCCH